MFTLVLAGKSGSVEFPYISPADHYFESFTNVSEGHFLSQVLH